MSREAFEAVIGKTVVEAEFRYLLLADPDQALAGFALTEEEAAILKKIDDETLEVLSSALDDRIRIGDPRRSPQAAHRPGQTGPLELLNKILKNA